MANKKHYAVERETMMCLTTGWHNTHSSRW